jgi:hypothetical protein
MQTVTESDRHDILIECGAHFELELQHLSGGEPTDLSDVTGSAVVKTWARGRVLLELDVTISDAPMGRFRLSAPPSRTRLMERSGIYAVKFSGPGDSAFRVVQGRAHLSVGTETGVAY